MSAPEQGNHGAGCDRGDLSEIQRVKWRNRDRDANLSPPLREILRTRPRASAPSEPPAPSLQPPAPSLKPRASSLPTSDTSNGPRTCSHRTGGTDTPSASTGRERASACFRCPV